MDGKDHGVLRPRGPKGRKGRRLLPNLRPEDLRDLDRLQQLYEFATGRGLPATEANWIQFIAAAVHATSERITNPPGNFHASIKQLARGERLLPVSQAEEEAAVRWLKSDELSGVSGAPRSTTSRGEPPRLPSLDAKRVAATLLWAQRHHQQGDPFEILHNNQPGWSRERWDRALAELQP